MGEEIVERRVQGDMARFAQNREHARAPDPPSDLVVGRVEEDLRRPLADRAPAFQPGKVLGLVELAARPADDPCRVGAGLAEDGRRFLEAVAPHPGGERHLEIAVVVVEVARLERFPFGETHTRLIVPGHDESSLRP